MFSACPHCGYLIALIDGALPALCPKCGGSLAHASGVEGSVVDTYSIRSRHKKSHQRAHDQSQATLNIDPLPRSAPTSGATAAAQPSPPAASRPSAVEATSPTEPIAAMPAAREPLTDASAVAPSPKRSPAEQMAQVFGGKTRPMPPAAHVIEQARVAQRASSASTASPAAADDGMVAQLPRQSRGTPSFARRQMEAARAHGHDPLRIAVIAMTLLLVLQILLAKREDMAASARWRPLASAVCTVLFCKLPAWHEPRAFALVQRNVRPHPTTPGVLSVSASFRNDARWAQAWPTLILSLSDVDGRQVGTRSFRPDEYRPAGAAPTLEPGQTTQVQFDVIEPAPRIVAFNFDFR